MELLTHRKRWKEIISTEYQQVGAYMLELAGQPECILPASVMVLASEQNRNTSGGIGKKEPVWIEVRHLTSKHFVAVPADLHNSSSHENSVIAAYLAGSVVADGISNENSFKIPSVLTVPGMGQMMMRSALKTGILKCSGTTIRPAKELKKNIRMILDGNEQVSLMGTDEKLAICRGWMESHAPRTSSRQAVLMMSRLIRSMMRETHAINIWKTNNASIHTLSPLAANFRNGMIIEGGMAWLKVKSCLEYPDSILYEKHLVQDDDSHVYDGIYVRDSLLRTTEIKLDATQEIA